jgi:CPA2 family monovalent cation:H+ antiporter-2
MAVNTALAFLPVIVLGRFVLSRVFCFVADAGSPVAIQALSFLTVFRICFVFQVFGLSNTLGAFVAGVLLSGTAFCEQVHAAISPIREDLLGPFFITLGFGIDLNFVVTQPLWC